MPPAPLSIAMLARSNRGVTARPPISIFKPRLHSRACAVACRSTSSRGLAASSFHCCKS